MPFTRGLYTTQTTDMMNYILSFIFVMILFSCETSTRLVEGPWRGGLTPMHHPEMTNPLVFEVRYEGNTLAIDIMGQDSIVVHTQNPSLRRDTLLFSFNEPEKQIPLRCVLARMNESEFAGRCTDPKGQWARFTMRAPK